MKINKEKVYLFLADSRFKTVKELAAAAEMSESNLVMILSGKAKSTRPGTVGRIARALECRAADLIERA